MTIIVKRKGHKQDFDERKIYASVYSAGINISLEEQEAEKIAAQVTSAIKTWVKNKKVVNSYEIFVKTADLLEGIDSNAAFMYKTHRDIS